MAPISWKRHRYPLPRWKFTPYVAKRPGYVPPMQKERQDGTVKPFIGFRTKDERLERRKRSMGGPYTRMVMIQKLVTELISMERMTMKYERGHEVRPYLERIIHTARFGPKDPEAMKLADFYINDKHLIYKLFHVIVPRFESATFGQYTRMYRLQPTGDGVNPGHANERCVLEIVGHPFPEMEPALGTPHKNNLLNVLLGRLKDRFENKHRAAVKGLTGAAQIVLHRPNKIDAYGPEHKLNDRTK